MTTIIAESFAPFRLQALLEAVPKLVSGLERSLEGAHHAAVAITTTDLVSKSAALEVRTLQPRPYILMSKRLALWVAITLL